MTRRYRAAILLWLVAPLLVSWYPARAEKAVGTGNDEPSGGLVCPSREFSKFVGAFSEDVRVQKRFTRFPLEYRYIDAHLVGTENEDAASKKRMIKSFEASPFRYGEKRLVKLFPNKLERKKARLEMKERLSSNEVESTDDRTIHLFEPDTDHGALYRFHRNETCWYLYLVDNHTL